MLPVARLRIVGSELDDDDLGLKVSSIRVCLELPIRLVPLLQQGGPVDSEIPDLELFPEHASELGGITILYPILDRGSERYAVSHASDSLGSFPGCLASRPRGCEYANGGEERKKGFSIHDSPWLGDLGGGSKIHQASTPN
jgi:hypothetical protein